MVKHAKKGRPRSENPMVHTAVVLPRDLIEHLRKDAEAADRGLSTEIRQRLQLTYDWEGLPRDPQTSDLVEAIKILARNIASDVGEKWYEHRYALAAFKAGVATFLALHQPEGDERVRPDMGSVGGPDDPPDVVGRIHARLIIAANVIGALPNEKKD